MVRNKRYKGSPAHSRKNLYSRKVNQADNIFSATPSMQVKQIKPKISADRKMEMQPPTETVCNNFGYNAKKFSSNIFHSTHALDHPQCTLAEVATSSRFRISVSICLISACMSVKVSSTKWQHRANVLDNSLEMPKTKHKLLAR